VLKASFDHPSSVTVLALLTGFFRLVKIGFVLGLGYKLGTSV